MPIAFRCDSCRQRMAISSRKAGQEVECPGCGATTRVPVPNESRHAITHRTEIPDPEAAGGFTVRRARGAFDEMDLTPMVDVTFLLLIFFMITAAFSTQKAISFPPPDPEQKGAVQSVTTLDELLEDSVRVTIDERNTITVDDEPVASGDPLVALLRDRSLYDGRTELLLDAHDQALHDTVVQVIDAAADAGMQRIRIVSRTDP